MTYYHRYYRRKNTSPNIFEMISEILFALAVLFWKIFFKLITTIFTNRNKIKGVFKLNEKVVTDSSVQDIQTPEKMPTRYNLKDSLLTEAEKNFLSVLKEVVGDKYQIESQVQISSIVKPIDSNTHFTNYTDFNKIKAKSIDFVLFDNSFKPCIAIELDDSSHLHWDRMRRDRFVEDVMRGVGLRLVRIPVSYSYNIDDLKRKIL